MGKARNGNGQLPNHSAGRIGSVRSQSVSTRSFDFAESPAMNLELTRHFDKARNTVTEVSRIVSSHKYSGDRRSIFVRGLLASMIQYHQSVLHLIKSAAVVSSYALTRDIVKDMRNGLWINSCATEEQILQLEKTDEFPLSIPEMTTEIEAAYSATPSLGARRTDGELGSNTTLYPVWSNWAVGRVTPALDCTSTMKKFGTR